MIYLDSSSLVKLVRLEEESAALQAWLAARRGEVQVTSALARVEVIRAAHRHGPQVVASARALLTRPTIIRLDDAILEDAAMLPPDELRTLDALHVATARRLGPELTAVVTYDQRMAAAAAASGLPTVSPT